MNTGLHDVLIAFGSNLGDPHENYKQACIRLLRQLIRAQSSHESDGASSLEFSSPLATEPVGGPAGQKPYVNGAIRVRTPLDVQTVHQCMIDVEQSLGRTRTTRWGSRTADLDLLLYDEMIFESPTLTVPHPRMSFRRFVLEPALEIGATMIHPVSGKTIAELVEHLNSADDRILFVDPANHFSPEQTQSLQQDIAARQPWQLVLSESIPKRTAEPVTAKLVVLIDTGPEGEPRSPVGAPVLRIGHEPYDQLRSELLAAIEAMSTDSFQP